MLMRTIATATTLLIASTAVAQRPVQWSNSLERSVATSKRTLQPLLVYVPTSDSENDNLEQAIKRTLRDSFVVTLIDERFVPVRMSRSNRNMQYLRKWNAPTGYGGYVVAVTPRGEAVGILPQTTVADADRLVTGLTDLYRRYRADLYRSELQKKLTERGADANDIRKVLRVVEKLIITEADDDIVSMLSRHEDHRAIQKDAYDALAKLSTPAAVQKLLDDAEEERLAARALGDITPKGAQYLLTRIDVNKPEQSWLVFETVTDVCEIKDAPNERAWTRMTPEVRNQQVQQVQAKVQDVAEKWERRIGRLR